MDLSLSPDDQAFQQEVRQFFTENLTPDLREAGALTGGVFAEVEASMRWHRKLAKKGWSATTWPKGTVAPAGRRRSATSTPARRRR